MRDAAYLEVQRTGAPLPDGAEIGQQLGLIEAAGRAFGSQPVLAEQDVGFVAVLVPEGDGHGLWLPPRDAGKAILVVLGNVDAVAAPTAGIGVGAGIRDHIPDVLILRRDGQREADVNAAEEGNRLAHLSEISRPGVGEGGERVAGEALLLPVVEHVQFHAAVVGTGIAGLVAVPLFVELFDGCVGEGDDAAGVCGPDLYGVRAAGDGAVVSYYTV